MVISMDVSFNSEENIGKPYRRGMLPFGGAVNSRGIITQVVSEAEYRRDMDILKSLVWFALFLDIIVLVFIFDSIYFKRIFEILR